MNIKDDLLKDAIADAKAVRETALANAKLAITEAFAPKIQSMLSSAIQNENDDDEFGMEDELNLDGGLGDEFGTDPSVDPTMGAAPVAPKVAETNGAPVSNAPVAPAPIAEVPMENTDEFSLENIIKELEQEAAMADGVNEPFTNEEAPIEEEAGSTQFGTADNKKPSPKSSKEQTEDPQGNIKPLHKSDAASETAAGKEYYLEEDINLEQLIKELKEEYSDVKEEEDKEKEEVDEVKKDLAEHREVIKYLRSKLNEVNLLNSKLLFTNILLKNHSLNEAQKYKVIETLDRATTIKESKLVYSTLEEAFSSIKANKNSTAKRIVESIASKNVGSTKPSAETQKNIFNEGTDLVNRLQKLAGIKK